MDPLLDSLEALKRHFGSDDDIVQIVDRERRLIKHWIDDHTPEEPKDKSPRKLTAVRGSEQPLSERSIFDDVDA